MSQSSHRIAFAPAFRCLGALSVLALATIGCTVGDRYPEYVETSRTSLAFAPQTRLMIDNSRGTYVLVEGEDDTVGIEAIKRVRAPDRDEAQEFADDIEVEILREGETLRVKVDYPGRVKRYGERTNVMGFRINRPGSEVDLTIALPTGTPVEVVTRSGDLSVDRFAGRLDFESSSGDVRLEEFVGDVFISSKSGDVYISTLQGELQMETSSGDLSLDSSTDKVSFDATSGDLEAGLLKGNLVATTASGDVDIEEALGRVQARTTSGDVTVKRMGGRFDAVTASGDVIARMVRPLEEAFVRTSSGDVRLVLTEPLRGRLRVNASSGEIVARLPMGVESAGKGRLVAVLGPGEGTLEVKTSSGDVQILHAEAE
jgi:DUF4097 and DUF4098 domain-containing protein YvlB